MASADLSEKDNFTRISRLLVDKGTAALRIYFDGIHPPANLLAVLTKKKKSFSKLKVKKIIKIPSGIYCFRHPAIHQARQPLM